MTAGYTLSVTAASRWLNALVGPGCVQSSSLCFDIAGNDEKEPEHDQTDNDTNHGTDSVASESEKGPEEKSDSSKQADNRATHGKTLVREVGETKRKNG